MLMEIIGKLTAIKDTSVVASDQVLAWDRWAEAQTTQTMILNSLKKKGLWQQGEWYNR